MRMFRAEKVVDLFRLWRSADYIKHYISIFVIVFLLNMLLTATGAPLRGLDSSNHCRAQLEQITKHVGVFM